MKKFTCALIIVTILLFLGIIFAPSKLLANTEELVETSEQSLLNIATVTKNQYNMIKSIVLDKHNIEYLVMNEDEINEFEYNEDITNNISTKDLFIYEGLNNEAWINSFINKLKKGNLGIINMSRGIKPLSYENNGIQENPYYWLGINEYKIALYNIKSAIQEKDPKNKNFYEENYNEVIKSLDEFLKETKLKLDKYKDYTILTNTNTFDYLLKDLGMQVIYVKDEVTRKTLEDKKIEENTIILIKDKNPIKIILDEEEQEEVKENTDIQDEKLENESEEPLEIETLELIRIDSEKTLYELIVSNINSIINSLEKLPNE